jgi:hypothetical protein
MRDVLITTSTANPQTGLVELKNHKYPFEHIPLVLSRVQPHYIIYDLGRKLDGLFESEYNPKPSKIAGLSFGDYQSELGSRDFVTSLPSFWDIYKRWVPLGPPESFIKARNYADVLPSDPAAPEYLNDGLGPFDSTSRRSSVEDGQDDRGEVEDTNLLPSSIDIEDWRQNVQPPDDDTDAYESGPVGDVWHDIFGNESLSIQGGHLVQDVLLNESKGKEPSAKIQLDDCPDARG